MSSRFAVTALVAGCIALAGLAGQPDWAKKPPTPVRLKASGFVVQTGLPHGWTYTSDDGFMAPAELAPACRVRVAFHATRNWDEFLVAALRPTDGGRPGERAVVRIDGHPAVSNRYSRKGVAIHDIYIDLSALHAGSGAVWTLEQRATSVPSDCELQFLAMVNKATITALPDAASPATP
ncbi:MAG TPA: hypothetical protein VM733_19640 [Thermoanaerobaculia bacterium]|nr:hypothetical protein [Thermoanaerobaculia bacterium]